MKKVISIAYLLFIGLSASNMGVNISELNKIEAPTEWDIFTSALIQVESQGDRLAIGKTQDVGILQITPIYVKEVNRILGEDKYTLDCRTDRLKSLEMFEVYQNYYNPKRDINKAIKLHNPGAGVDYKVKITKQIKQIKEVYENIQG